MEASSQLMERQRKLAALMALATNSDQLMTEDKVKLWMDRLEPYSADRVEQGVETVIREYQYKGLPPFATLVEAMDRIGSVSRPALLDVAALEAFLNVIDCAARHGRDYDVRLFDPVTAKVIHYMGGWATVCEWREEHLPYKKRNFLTFWKIYQENPPLTDLDASEILALIDEYHDRQRNASRPVAAIAK